MTTRVKIECHGPDRLGIVFFDCHGERTSDPQITLGVGQSYEFDTWDGKRAMPFALGHNEVIVSSEEPKFFSVPPACM